MSGLDIFYAAVVFIGIPAVVLGLFLLYWAATDTWGD